MRMLRKFVAWLLGPPLCEGCDMYGTNCLGHCGLSDEQRTKAFIEDGDWP
jgi:hypothetical protein